MAMRVDLRFAQPLGRAQARAVTLAVAALAGTRSVRITDGGYAAVVLGEALQQEAIAEALRAEGVPAEEIRSSVLGSAPAAEQAPAAPPSPDRERVRPLGR